MIEKRQFKPVSFLYRLARVKFKYEKKEGVIVKALKT